MCTLAWKPGLSCVNDQNPSLMIASLISYQQIPVCPLSLLTLNHLLPPGQEDQHSLAPCRRSIQICHPALELLSFPGVSAKKNCTGTLTPGNGSAR